jgi:hypothetical protein
MVWIYIAQLDKFRVSNFDFCESADQSDTQLNKFKGVTFQFSKFVDLSGIWKS